MPSRAELQRFAVHVARVHGLDVAPFFALIQTESNWNPTAYRYEPAFYRRYILGKAEWEVLPWGKEPRRIAASYGLGQLMYTSAVAAGYPRGKAPEGLYDPITNLELTAKRWRRRLLQARGDLRDAYSRYNSGRPLEQAPANTRLSHVPNFVRNLRAAGVQTEGTGIDARKVATWSAVALLGAAVVARAIR